MDQSYLDFGKVPYDVEDEEKEFNIINPGRVPFDFRLRLDELSRPDIIVAKPTSGRVYAGDKQKITIKFMPGVPDRIMEQVKVDIAHLNPFCSQYMDMVSQMFLFSFHGKMLMMKFG